MSALVIITCSLLFAGALALGLLVLAKCLEKPAQHLAENADGSTEINARLFPKWLGFLQPSLCLLGVIFSIMIKGSVSDLHDFPFPLSVILTGVIATVFYTRTLIGLRHSGPDADLKVCRYMLGGSVVVTALSFCMFLPS